MNICIFEDALVSNLAPVNCLRHTSELVCGALTLKEKIQNILPGKKFRFIIHSRRQIEQYCREKFPGMKINSLPQEDTLFLNSRIIYSSHFTEGLMLNLDEFENTILLKDKTIAAIYGTKSKWNSLRKIIESRSDKNTINYNEIKNLKFKEIQLDELSTDLAEDIIIINYPSDLILNLEEEIRKDLKILFNRNRNTKQARVKAEIINKSGVFISGKCSISTNVVLDASKGNIYISDGAVIEPFTYVKGPVFIGENTAIKSGTSLYGPVCIGSNSRVSGEITSSILHSYINKQHLGFLGHSYLCEWVNLGAGTTTSNLKNNYSRISLKLDGRNIDTGSIFLGSIIGDHTKTGINTMLNTGTTAGISSNLFGSGYHAKYVPNFSWTDAGTGKLIKYDINKSITTAKVTMKRRNVTMSNAYENLMIYYFKKPG